MKLDIFEGEYKMTKNNHLLGGCVVQKVPEGIAGSRKVTMTFSVTEDGILTVSATTAWENGGPVEVPIEKNPWLYTRQELLELVTIGGNLMSGLRRDPSSNRAISLSQNTGITFPASVETGRFQSRTSTVLSGFLTCNTMILFLGKTLTKSSIVNVGDTKSDIGGNESHSSIPNSTFYTARVKQKVRRYVRPPTDGERRQALRTSYLMSRIPLELWV